MISFLASITICRQMRKTLEDYLGIPYIERQSGSRGMDCLGLVGHYYGIKLWEGYAYDKLEDGIKYLADIGFKESPQGELAVMNLKRADNNYHMGIIEGDHIYHASKVRGKVVRDNYQSFKKFIVVRLSYGI